MLICWNDIKIHLGFEDSYFVPPPTSKSTPLLVVAVVTNVSYATNKLIPALKRRRDDKCIEHHKQLVNAKFINRRNQCKQFIERCYVHL